MTSEEIIARQGEIEQRKAEIEATLENPEADLDALNEEARALAEESESLKNQLAEMAAKAAEEEELRKKIADGDAGETKEEHKEEKHMDMKEIRSSAAYCEAYKKLIITGDDKECRALLSANADTPGDVPVPTLVEEIIKTEWEGDEFLRRITKTFFRGNLKVPFEKSADMAYNHSEGTTGLTEQNLEIGTVTLTPMNAKKWLTISDEAVAMGGEEFIRYIYREMAHYVLARVKSNLIAKANAAGTTHSSTVIGIPKATEAPAVMTVQNAAAQLTEDATDICVLLNPLTIQSFNNAYASGNFAINPFDGVTVIKCSALPAYSSADDNAMYGIVGDLKAFQANYPEGEDVVIKWDDLTLAEDDMVKVVARQYVGVGVTAPGRLVKLCKPAAAVTT